MLTRTLVCLLLLTPSLAAADYDEAFHPDGSLQYKIKLARDGLRTGKYVIYYPGGAEGKKGEKAEIGSYRAGQLHGVITKLSEDGEVLSESQWTDGVCLIPLTERFISQRLKDIEAAAAASVAALPNDGRARPDDRTLVAVLTRTNHYRLLCGLDHDVAYDSEFVNEAQCAAEICDGIGQMDHHPKNNPGLSDERWEAGKIGCARGNLAMGILGVGAVDAWIDDSDASNRDRLPHRHAALAPGLKRMGYGESGRFSVQRIRDKGTTERDVPAVRFPPQGLMPLQMFGSHYCWHIRPDGDRYNVGKDAQLEIRPCDPNSGARGEPLEIDYRIVNRGAVVALPKQIPLKRNAMFHVTVTGVSKKDESAPDLDWITIFY